LYSVNEKPACSTDVEQTGIDFPFSFLTEWHCPSSRLFYVDYVPLDVA